jgi:hypothetical protein|eukprot:611526-Prymnesium_polylepis.1
MLLHSECVVLQSLDFYQLCGLDQEGDGKFTPDAINAICDALTKSNVHRALGELKLCSIQHVQQDTRPSPLAIFASCGCCSSCSLNFNNLCGLSSDSIRRGSQEGRFTLDAINALCEALTKSNT